MDTSRSQIQTSLPKHGSSTCPFVSVVYRSSLVHKHAFVWRAIFHRTNQGTRQGWMPHFQNPKSKRNHFICEMGKNVPFPLCFWYEFVDFWLFSRSWCCHLSRLLFLLFCILFILKSHCMLCLKGTLKEKCMKIKSKSKKKRKKKVAGIPNICLSCLLQQMLVFKVTFSMKRKKN